MLKKQIVNKHQLWIDEELYQKLVNDKVRDESVNSYIGYLYEFHKNASPQINEVMKNE